MRRLILSLCCALFLARPAGAAPADFSGNPQAQRFYQLRHGELVWTGGPQAQANARAARAILATAAADGLDPDRYRITPSGDLGRDDAALTNAMLSYLQDLAVGRAELRALDPDVGLPARDLDTAARLDEALRKNQLAALPDHLAPSQPGYRALKAALAETADPVTRDVLAANMERWRWLPGRLEPDRIEVNAARAELELWLGGRKVLSSRVIVGKPQTPTPLLRAEGAGVTINPSWTVPKSIAAKEFLPKLKRNAAWLASQDMVLLNGPPGDPHGLSVNWRAIPAGTFPYQVRQAPGARNPLGQVKLELPNRFDVYLHDTPGRDVFARANRALSHGCVRVEQILPLASYALVASPDAMAEIRNAIGKGQTRYLPLSHKVPVYMLYWTAYADDAGQVRFAGDIYGRDRRMIAAFRHAPARIAAVEPGCRKA